MRRTDSSPSVSVMPTELVWTMKSTKSGVIFLSPNLSCCRDSRSQNHRVHHPSAIISLIVPCSESLIGRPASGGFPSCEFLRTSVSSIRTITTEAEQGGSMFFLRSQLTSRPSLSLSYHPRVSWEREEVWLSYLATTQISFGYQNPSLACRSYSIITGYRKRRPDKHLLRPS